MPQFIAIEPSVEVNGQTVLAILNGVGEVFKPRIAAILAKHGIAAPKTGEWYLQQKWLNAFKEIYEKIGNHTLFAIGKCIPQSAEFPKEISTLHDALSSLDIAYHLNHRNGEIGYYKILSFDEVSRKAEMECKNPYPCYFDKGIIMTLTRMFKPEDSINQDVIINTKFPTRAHGAESTFYDIFW